MMKNMGKYKLEDYKIIVYKDGSYTFATPPVWEYENDENYLTTIDLSEAIDCEGKKIV